jgi:hypothetical protein
MHGGGSQTTVQKSEPWSGQQPYLKDIYSQAAGLYGNAAGYTPYPGQRVAGMTPMQNQGIDAAYGNIVGGNTSAQNAEAMLTKTLQGGYGQSNPYLQAATGGKSMAGNTQSLMDKTIGGGFVGSNPYLDDVFKTSAQAVTDQFNQQILPGLKTQGIQGGMYNSSRQGIAEGLAAGEAQKGLLNLAAQIYAPAYENERSRQMQAAQMQTAAGESDLNRMLQGAGLYQTGYENERQRQMTAAGLSPTLSNWGANQLINLGAYDQNQLQNELNAQQNYWNEYQMAPLQRLGNYSQQVMAGGSPGGTSTFSTSGGGGSSLTGLLGGAAMGAGIAGSLPTAFMASNPYMWPVLIGGGALMGGF